MSLTRIQKLGLVGFIVIICGFILVLYNLNTGNFKDWVGIPELVVIFGFLSLGFFITLIMIIPYTVNVELTDEEIYFYRKHLRESEACFKYREIIKAYFDYLAYDTAIVFERNEKKYFVNVGGEVVAKHPEIKKKLLEKGVKIERASERTYKDHDVEFNRNVNKIRKSCDEVILIYA